MEDLIKRLEAATGPSRELDAEIVRLVAGWKRIDSPGGADWIDPRGYEQCDRDVPHYTASIDAALTLVPEHWSATISTHPNNIGTFARVYNDGMKTEPAFNVHGNRPPAIALCIAALKARGTSHG